jgi:hypothetical protein
VIEQPSHPEGHAATQPRQVTVDEPLLPGVAHAYQHEIRSRAADTRDDRSLLHRIEVSVAPAGDLYVGKPGS